MVPRSEASWGAAPGSTVAAGEWNKLQHSLRQDQHGSQEWTVRGLDTPGARDGGGHRLWGLNASWSI